MNPLTEARELGRKAGLSATEHLGTNPFLSGQRQSEHLAWETGYNEVQPARPVTEYMRKIKAAYELPAHGGTEKFERK